MLATLLYPCLNPHLRWRCALCTVATVRLRTTTGWSLSWRAFCWSDSGGIQSYQECETAQACRLACETTACLWGCFKIWTLFALFTTLYHRRRTSCCVRGGFFFNLYRTWKVQPFACLPKLAFNSASCLSMKWRLSFSLFGKRVQQRLWRKSCLRYGSN